MEDRITELLGKYNNWQNREAAKEIAETFERFITWFYSEYKNDRTLQIDDWPLIYGHFSINSHRSGTIEELFTYYMQNIYKNTNIKGELPTL